MNEERDMNRLHNISNPHQGERKRVLCLCSAGLLRSPTAAWLLSNPPYEFNTRAAGVHDYALIRVDHVLCRWADTIVAMGEEHVIPQYKDKTIVLGIPDNFGFRSPELIRALRAAFDKHFPQEGAIVNG